MKKTSRLIGLDGIIIKGWKGMVEYTGYHHNTLMRWHSKIARMPFIKTGVGKHAKWIMTPDRVLVWFKVLGKRYKDQKR